MTVQLATTITTITPRQGLKLGKGRVLLHSIDGDTLVPIVGAEIPVLNRGLGEILIGEVVEITRHGLKSFVRV